MKNLDMKKILTPQVIGLILIVLGIAAVVAILITKNNDDETANMQKTPAASPYKTVNSCQAFTLADAKKILGDTAKKSSGTSLNASSKDTAVSTCIYGQDSSTVPINKAQNLKTATLLSRSPKTAIGKQSNLDQFGKSKPAGVQDVSGIGEKAFWSPTYGQLNVLKDNVWVIISTGSSAPSTHSLDDAKKMAGLIVPNL
jgi:hypothetical protein